jgi:hypothetical protein
MFKQIVKYQLLIQIDISGAGFFRNEPEKSIMAIFGTFHLWQGKRILQSINSVFSFQAF